MQLSKKKLGINGQHAALGHQIDEAEFKGYMIAKMEEITKQREEFREAMGKHALEDDARFTKSGERVGGLEKYVENARGFIVAISILIPIVVTLVLKYVLQI